MKRRRTGTVEETPWWLEVNAERVAHGTATPYRLEALAGGRLLVDGYIRSVGDLRSLAVVYDPPGCVGLRARVPEDQATAAQRRRVHCEQHGCGARYYLTCDRDALPVAGGGALPPPDAFPQLFRQLFRAVEQYGRMGGMHAASLTDGSDLLEPIAEVGRHNAVDKAIGWAVLEGLDRSMLGLVLTSRVSAAIAVKAARAGLAWVASRSIPTDLAVEIAAAARMPIVARAAGSDAHLFGALPSGQPFADVSPEPEPDRSGPGLSRPPTAPEGGPGAPHYVPATSPDSRPASGDQGSGDPENGERVVGEPVQPPAAPDAV